MNNTPYEKIVARIAKLLALADRGGTPEEAATAAGQAQALMTKYKIEAAVVAAHGDAPDVPDEPTIDSPEPLLSAKRIATWRVLLAQAVAAANNVYIFRSGSDIVLVGCESDIQTVRYLNDLLHAEVERLVKSHCRGTTRTWKNNFRFGVVDAIRGKLQAARKAEYAQARTAAANPNALVVVNKALDKLDKRARDAALHARTKFNLRSGGSRSYRGNADARAQGLAAGATVNMGGRATAGLGAGRQALRG